MKEVDTRIIRGRIRARRKAGGVSSSRFVAVIRVLDRMLLFDHIGAPYPLLLLWFWHESPKETRLLAQVPIVSGAVCLLSAIVACEKDERVGRASDVLITPLCPRGSGRGGLLFVAELFIQEGEIF